MGAITIKKYEPVGEVALPEWVDDLTVREVKDIEDALMYIEHLNHGAVGHNMMGLVAKLVRHLTQAEREIMVLKVRLEAQRTLSEEYLASWQAAGKKLDELTEGLGVKGLVDKTQEGSSG